MPFESGVSTLSEFAGFLTTHNAQVHVVKDNLLYAYVEFD